VSRSLPRTSVHASNGKLVVTTKLPASGSQRFRGWLGTFGGENVSPPRGDRSPTCLRAATHRQARALGFAPARAGVASRSARGAVAPIGTLRGLAS